MSAHAIIAVRGGPEAKSRLAGRLDAGQRDALVQAMLADMLASLSRCASVAGLWVTTPTAALARLAGAGGAMAILDRGPDGLNGAFRRARRRIAAADPDATVMLLPGDLPRLDPGEVARCLRAAGPRRLVLAPARADGGTGGLVARAAVPLPLAFGPGSFARHLGAARALGLEGHTIREAGLGLDLDRPEDLEAFASLGGGGLTGRLLRAWRATS